MRTGETFRLARTLADTSLVRRGVVVSALVLAERLLTFATAVVLVHGGLPQQIGAAATLSALFALRGIVQRTAMAHAEASLCDRLAASMVRGDVLRSSVLPDRDVHLEIAQSVYYTASLLAKDLPALVGDTVGCVALGGLVLAFEPGGVVAVGLASMMLGALVVLATRRIVERANQRVWAARAGVDERIADAIDGRLEIAAFGQTESFLAEFRRETADWAREQLRVSRLSAISGRIPLVAVGLAVAIVVALAARTGRGISVALADAAILASVVPAFAQAAQGAYAILRAEPWIRLAARIIGQSGTPAGGSRPASETSATIRLVGVSFAYDGDTPRKALRDVTLQWDAGTTLAIRGANGSGKSTCLRLLLALAAPTSGEILVGDTPLSELAGDSWRQRIAFLPQGPYLPPRSTIRAAIHFLAPGVGDDQMLRALDRVALTERLNPGGGSPLDVRIDTLSVGQRQRVALARLLCREASIVLLDEPDANLDAQGVSQLAGIIRDLARHRRVAFVAHSEELVRIADRVVTFEAGNLVSGDSYQAKAASR